MVRPFRNVKLIMMLTNSVPERLLVTAQWWNVLNYFSNVYPLIRTVSAMYIMYVF